MARLTRAESQAKTREMLLASGRAAFARSGFDGASIDEIAEGAGYSKGAFYSNFESKEALALEIMRDDTEGAQRLVARLLEESEGDGEKMLSHLVAIATALADDRGRHALRAELYLHAMRSPEFAVKFSELYLRRHQRIKNLASVLFQRLNLADAPDPYVIASIILSMGQGHALLRGAGDKTPFGDMMHVLLGGVIKRARASGAPDPAAVAVPAARDAPPRPRPGTPPQKRPERLGVGS